MPWLFSRPRGNHSRRETRRTRPLHPSTPACLAPSAAQPDHDPSEREKGDGGYGPPCRGLEEISSRVADEVTEEKVSLEEHRASENQEGERLPRTQLRASGS